MMEAHSRDDICFAPACPAISGGEGHHEKIDTCKAVDRHNHGPAGLHEGLSSDAMRIVARRQGRSPRQSAIAGGAHLDQVTQSIVIKLGVAVAVERAAGRIVADRPVLVVKMAVIIHHDGSAPGQSPIGRAADIHIDRTAWVHNTQVGDEPDIVLGIKGHRGIAGTRVGARRCRVDSGAWQEAFGKALPTIGGRGEPNVGSTTIGEATHLEGGHEGGTGRKSIWSNSSTSFALRVLLLVRSQVTLVCLGASSTSLALRALLTSTLKKSLIRQKAMGTTKRCNGIIRSIFILHGNVNLLDYPEHGSSKSAPLSHRSGNR